MCDEQLKMQNIPDVSITKQRGVKPSNIYGAGICCNADLTAGFPGKQHVKAPLWGTVVNQVQKRSSGEKVMGDIGSVVKANKTVEDVSGFENRREVAVIWVKLSSYTAGV